MNDGDKNAELAALERRVKELQKRLTEAENVLRFYANSKNYIASKVEVEITFFDRLVGDAAHTRNGSVIGGARARNYLKRFCNE